MGRMYGQTQILLEVGDLGRSKEKAWLQALGSELTIAARGAYVPGELAADAVALMDYNELQHQLYQRYFDLNEESERPLESFIDVLYAKASTYKVDGGFIYALTRSLKHNFGTPRDLS